MIKNSSLTWTPQKSKLTVYIFSLPENDLRNIRFQLTPLANKYAQYAQFCIADAIEYAPLATQFGLPGDRFPAIAVHAPMNNQYFTFREGRKIDAEEVEKMLVEILQGKAVSGQVFGEEDLSDVESEGGEGQEVRGERDEL